MFENVKKTFEVKQKSTEPYINVPIANRFTGLFSRGLTDKRRAMDYAKRQPIIIGIVRAIATDIVSRISFRSVQIKTGKGRPSGDMHEKAEQKASEFAKKQFVKQKLYSAVLDWLITGEAFLWHGSVKKDKVKEIFSKLNVFPDDMDIKGVNLIKQVPSTTMDPKYDLKNIKWYEQNVRNAAEPLKWSTDDIIHAKFMELDGKPSGFTPMFAAKPMIETLGLIIDYAGYFFDGGGLPEKIINFPKEMANSENFRRAKLEFKRYYNTKRRGHIFIAGDELKVFDLNNWNKDLEFEKLFMLYVGSIAFAFNMPLHRIQAIVGGNIKSSAGSSDLADSGYWRSIYEGQDYWENLMNVGFWNDAFGVDMELERKYLQDTVRETQATQMAIQNVEALERNGLIKDGYKRQVYSQMISAIPNEAFNNEPKPPTALMSNGMLPQSGSSRQGKLPNSDILKGQATKKMSDEKRKQAGKTESQTRGN